MKTRLALALLVALASFDAGAVDIDAFVKKDKFTDVKISPTGEFLAAAVPLDDRTILVVLRRSDNKITGRFSLGQNSHVDEFVWVSPTRLLISPAERLGALDAPSRTGELYAINADGSHAENLVGYRVEGSGSDTHIQVKKVEDVMASLVDDLPNDDKYAVISVQPFTGDAYSRAERLDVMSGRRWPITTVPVRNASFFTDNAGVVRFATGFGADRSNKLYYRKDERTPWELLGDESRNQRPQQPLGFSEDNRIAYLQVAQDSGPDSIVAMDVASGKRSEVLRNAVADPGDGGTLLHANPGIVYRPGSGVPIGATFRNGKGETVFFDPTSADARLQRSLEAAFAGSTVELTSRTQDGRLALVHVSSDRNPGDFYLFDTTTKKADLLVSSRSWFEPERMNPMEPIEFASRDGTKIHGYVTRPVGHPTGLLPMVVLPHGGPFGIRDVWRFDDDAQLLASAGYAVLQVNYRGSGGYGWAFEQSGGREWGGKMQDDLTDATRWAVKQGIADVSRICLYGSSYGGYAALMGVAKEPTLYKCAAGYVGVYDLPLMYSEGDTHQVGSGKTYLNEWVGLPEEVAKVSPARLADQIKVPVFLAAGGRDERAPIGHSKLMEKALLKAGVPVETLYYPNEGHGFYEPEHRREFYRRLLDFLARNIGGQRADAPLKAVAAKAG